MRRSGPLLLTIAAAAAVPLLEPAAGAERIARAVPDFSGIWAHPYLTGFEPPASGPGPVRNKSRLPSGVSNFQQLVGDDTNPILKPDAARRVREHGAISLAGIGYPTPSNQCWPGGVPYVFWDFLMQMFQQPHQITMVYRQSNEVRRVRMNEPHRASAPSSWYGDSVGHYEGDTLVIDTIGLNTKTFVDNYRTPHSEKLHVVERWRLIDGGKQIEVHMTIDDPETYNQPWQVIRRYDRDDGELGENICREGNFVLFNYGIPIDESPDF